MPLKFLEYLVILCFKRRYLIKNTVVSLKLIILPSQKIFGLATLLYRRTMNKIYVLTFFARVLLIE